MMGALGITIYYIVFQSFYNITTEKTVFPYHSVHDLARSIVLNFTPIILTFLATAFTVFSLVKIENTKLKVLVDILCCTVIYFAINFGFLLVMRWTGHPTWSRVDWGGAAFNSIFILLGLEAVYYIISFKNTLKMVEHQKQMALQYKYMALKAQLNPHFLFNSLNILYSLVSIDQQKSKEFVLALSQMYRYVMAQQERDDAALSDEIEFLHAYISVLKMRYNQQFAVDFHGLDGVSNQRIVPNTMQLLIENVTKHNVISDRYPMTVKIEIGADDITIENPIRLRRSNASSHVGLRYLTQLYSSHGKDFRVENDGVTFKVIVPYL